MKRTYISPETLAVEPYTAQGVMDGLVIMSTKKADPTKEVLTKRKVWDDVDDEEEW